MIIIDIVGFEIFILKDNATLKQFNSIILLSTNILQCSSPNKQFVGGTQ